MAKEQKQVLHGEIIQNRRTDLQIARDRKEESRLYLLGYSQAAIAEKLNLNISTVRRDLGMIEKAWSESGVMNLNEMRLRELARIDVLEFEYWSEWEKSKEPLKTKTAKQTKRAGGSSKNGKSGADDIEETAGLVDVESTALVRTEERLGNPAYLAGVERCIEKRCRLLGLNAPERTANFNFDLSKMSDDELAELIERLDNVGRGI